MHFHAAPSVAAEVPGFSLFSQEQLDRLARSVELRRQQLEQDINAYIQRKQDELRQYEIELVEQHRSMERDEDAEAAGRRDGAESAATTTEDIAAQPSPTPTPTCTQPPPEEQKKQKKHGRVHKREKELYGLVTPVFLPLLDAREPPSPTKEEKKAAKALKLAARADAGTTPSAGQSTAARDAQHSTARRNSQDEGDMAGETAAVKERSASDPGKKSRRSSIKKKSALRHSSTPRNRKRVSLVIDDQVVLPSDMIQEPALTSPGSESTSATNSTASLDDMIDPRLTATDAPVYIEHHDAVHHSLPLTASAPQSPPAKPSAPPLSNPPPAVTEPAHSVSSDIAASLRSPTPTYAPPSYATRSFLDPPPERQHIEDIPPNAGAAPIYPSQPEHAAPADSDFSTYVGGISGSGVDDVNQAGSIGYPSSLGASYLESYMQTRPLSVRMAAAEREGDGAEVQRLRALEERRRKKESEESARAQRESAVLEDEWSQAPKPGAADEDGDDFMGSMDDF